MLTQVGGSAASSTKGQRLCLTGFNVGTLCGSVTSTDFSYTASDGVTIKHLYLTNTCGVQPGASGGPVFTTYTVTTSATKTTYALAHGLVSGSSTTSCAMAYQGINTVLKAYGVEVLSRWPYFP